MGSDSRPDLQNSHPKNYADALNLLAAHDGVQLNQQFINDITKLTGGMLELQNKGVLPNVAMDSSGTGSGSGDYVRTASVQENAPTGSKPDNAKPADTKSGDDHHGPGTWESLANGAVADQFRAGGDLLRAAGDVGLAPLNGFYQQLKGGLGTEWNGLKDLAHGDILGGVGNIVAGPFVGAWDGLKGSTGELWNGTKNVWHAVENEFNSLTHTARGLFDFGRAAGDVVLSPVAAVYDNIKGTIGSEIDGVKDLAHGDIVGATEHIVGAPLIGTWDGLKGGADKLEHGVKNVWHGIENIL